MLRASAIAVAALISLAAIACSGYNQSPTPDASVPTPGSAGTVSTQVAAVPCPPAPPVPPDIPNVPPAPADAKPVTTPSGLQYIDITPGTGATAASGQTASVNYTGWLLNGTKFDSSADHGGQPFSFPLGGGQVIKGWDEGVAGMHVGGKRRLIVPPDLAYGSKGAGGVIPPCSTLIFDVDLLGAK